MRSKPEKLAIYDEIRCVPYFCALDICSRRFWEPFSRLVKVGVSFPSLGTTGDTNERVPKMLRSLFLMESLANVCFILVVSCSH